MSWSRKSRLLARLGRRHAPLRRHGRATLEETRFLVAAAVQALPAPAPPSAVDLGGAEGRIVWLVDLFKRLEQEEQAALRNARRDIGRPCTVAQAG